MIEKDTSPNRANARGDNLEERQVRRISDVRVAGWILFVGVSSAFVVGIVTSLLPVSSDLLKVSGFILELAGALGVALGIRGVFKNRVKAREKVKLIVATLAVIIIGLMVTGVGFLGVRVIDISNRMVRATRMSNFGSAFYWYAEKHNGSYPPPENWCDVLLEGGYLAERQFRCPSRWWGRCHYAMNPNCTPESASDVVLVFESQEDWNQHGGPELMAFVSNDNKWCYVVFNDLSFDQVFEVDLRELNWGQKEKETE